MHKTLYSIYFDRTNTCHKLVSYERTNTITLTTESIILCSTFSISSSLSSRFVSYFSTQHYSTYSNTHTHANHRIALSRCGMPANEQASTLLPHAHTNTSTPDRVSIVQNDLMLGPSYATEYTISPVWIRQRQKEATLHVACIHTNRFILTNFFFFASLFLSAFLLYTLNRASFKSVAKLLSFCKREKKTRNSVVISS